MFSFAPDAVWGCNHECIVIVMAASGPVIHSASGARLFNVAAVVAVVYILQNNDHLLYYIFILYWQSQSLFQV